MIVLRVNKNYGIINLRISDMKEDEIKRYVGIPIEAVVMDSRMVIKGTLESVDKGQARFSSIEDIFALVHGKRLSMKLMLAGSFIDLEALLKSLYFPCSVFDRCRRLDVKG